MNTQIIQACPNVKHVDNLANYDTRPNRDLKDLTAVLKEKSLVSFSESLSHDSTLRKVCKSELSLLRHLAELAKASITPHPWIPPVRGPKRRNHPLLPGTS